MIDQVQAENEAPARMDLDGVRIGYNGTIILDELSFQVPHGALMAVVGPNGAGKSTLFKALVGLIPVLRGNIRIHGRPLGEHRDCVAYVPQREEVDWRFPVTVRDVVMMGRFGRIGWLRQPQKDDRIKVEHAMEQMNILPLAGKSIAELSGGQQQRVFLARALAQEPHILLMDEPFTGVDLVTQETTLGLLDQLKREKVTVLVSTHDLELAAQRFDLVLLLNRRLVAYGTPAFVFQPEHIRQAFGSKALFLESMVVVDECCPPE